MRIGSAIPKPNEINTNIAISHDCVKANPIAGPINGAVHGVATVVAKTPVKNDPLYPPLEVSSLPVPIKLVPISKTPDRLNAIKKNT